METKNLLELIMGGENSRVELKIAPPRPAELAQRLCGMANAQGGYIILGVEDGSLEIKGLKNPAEATDEVLRAARLCKPTLVFDPPEPVAYLISGKTVLVATVAANQNQLYQASGVFWIRRGTHTVPLEVHEIEQYLYNKGISSWERKVVTEATLEDLDLEIVREWAASRPDRLRRGGRLDNLEELLLNLRCAERANKSGTIHPTNAGLLLFGKYPQRFIIQGEITCILYGENLGTQRFVDRRVISGTVRDIIDGTEDFFRKYVAIPARMEGFHRIDEPEYPLEVLREAVVNAVVHRDYSLEGESIRVFYYPDRVEIRNPGQLMPGLTIEALEQGQAISKLRNPIIAGVLRDLPGGYMERAGSRVKYILERLEALGFPRPVFRQVGEFVVTFYNKGEVAPAETVTSPLAETGALEGRLEKLMQYLHKNGKVTNREYRQLTGISEATGLRDFELLVERGVIKALGKGRSRHYTLP